MMMSYGTFVFALDSAAFLQLQRQTSWRHATSERVGARPASQFLGPGDDTVELSGLIAPELTGTRASLDTLRELAADGEPLPLVDGAGVVYGPYLLLTVNETASLFFEDGTPRRIEFQLSLRRADDITPETAA
ncbi:phage tail protein [Xanthomonas oryzae]|uniref:phage tail protein n=1 Tax=Xanthomonas oryzae TaxID=347 RepID=UPI0023D91C7B|nr:phage tail protein [Xanthomonas oryzae]MDI9069980.1 phage tail protein [Xanthomonas oryzae pv. oryzae]MDI9080397.1 phage tail protein [Xanthomonas oryzae pv. oryzae]MDI9103163.1 phage tail protein [Xanthomonas oryzae pv. oryzae]MDI9911893.1 phage tail protein [Xanthomonas oryzae pv. oryzae]WEK99470.1 phage tail protein [Xanthomonas oryzae pv. oryzae]